MAEFFPIDINGTGNYYGNFNGNLTGTASYAVSASWAPGGGGGGSTDTSSLLTTASFSNPNLTFTKGNSSTFNINLTSLVPTTALTASYFSGSISNAILANTASVALSSSVKEVSNVGLYSLVFVDNTNTNSELLTDSASLNYNPGSSILYTTSSRAISSSIADQATSADTIGVAPNVSTNTFYSIPFASTAFGNASLYSDSSAINFNPSTNRLFITSISSSNITGSSFTGSFTGSLLGTSSWASNAITASYFSGSISNATSASYATTASYVLNAVSSSFVTSASYASQAGNASTIDINVFGSPVDSYLLMSNAAGTTGVAIGGDADLRYNASTNVLTVGNVSATSLTGSLLGTASWASNAVTASYVLNAISSSFASTASYVLNAISSSFATSASYATIAITSSYPIAVTGSTIYSTAPATSNVNTNNNIFLGGSAGLAAKNASNAIYLGTGAGYQSTNAAQSVFLGISAGRAALNAAQSNFIGVAAGMQASSASFSTLIGYYVGYSATSIGIKSNNIIIGTNITLPDNTQDSINLGGIIFATGSYSTTTGDPYSGSQYNIGKVGINVITPQYTLDVSGSGNYSNGLTVTGSIIATSFTGSLQGTASWATNALTASFLPVGTYNITSSWATSASQALTASYVLNAVSSSFTSTASFVATSSWATSASQALTASYIITAQTASYVLQAVSSSYSTLAQTANTASYVVTAQTASYIATASWAQSSSQAITASYALNGGVTQIVAGTNITISPVNGLGAVTINSTGGGSSGAGANVTASFTNQSTWTFVHGLGNRGVVVQTFDTSWNQTIPQSITLTDANTATIVFPLSQSGYAIASLGGVATTASFVTTLSQNVIITGSVAIGTGSIGNGENNLLLGPAPAGGAGEGGQIAFLAAGGSYASSSFIDNWQNQFRILRGPGAVSNAGLMYMDLQTGNTNFIGAVTASGGYSNLPNDYLYVTRNTDQTVGSSWANTDIIFNNTVVSKGISYNTGTGLASLTGGKVYRITARLAWSAAATYLLEFSCYNSSNTQLGPSTQIVQSTNGSFNISDGTLDFIYAPGSNVDIKIRTTANTTALSGEKIRGDLNTQLIIQQIA